MVTKSTRMQSRRTSTAGKVFTTSELLEGELGINMADKKMWFKDATGSVQRIAGCVAAISMRFSVNQDETRAGV
jgi:hypothetical protein